MELIGFTSNITWLSAVCLLAGLGFVIFEMFHPGFGAPGILGGILLFCGVVLTARNATDAVIMMLILIAILGVALMFVLRSATKGRLSRTLILNDKSKFTSSTDLNLFLGKAGTTLTALRPAGSADFEGEKLDVVSDGEFISKNSKVIVMKVLGRKIIVKEVK